MAESSHLGNIHTSKDGCCLTDARQALSQKLRGQVVQVQMDVVLLRAAPSPFPDLHGHRPRHHIPGRQILGCWSIPLHEALALRVSEDAALSSGALCDEAASSVDTCTASANFQYLVNSVCLWLRLQP